tara:strand:- start:243 stop:548 length:306 start_codon:yes stop_codon:yes gene_type:complete
VGRHEGPATDRQQRDDSSSLVPEQQSNANVRKLADAVAEDGPGVTPTAPLATANDHKEADESAKGSKAHEMAREATTGRGVDWPATPLVDKKPARDQSHQR